MGGVTLGIYAIHQTIITLLTSWFNIASLRLPYWLYVCCLWVMVSAILPMLTNKGKKRH